MKRAAAIGISSATLILALGYALSSLWVGALIITAWGLLWLVGQRRGWDWTPALGLIFLMGMAAFGLWLDLSAALMLFGAVAALAAWDLDHFSQRLRRAERVEGQPQLERAHLWRLLIVSGSGLLLGGASLSLRVEFAFGWAFLLGLLAVVGLGRTIAYFRRESH